MSTNESPSNEQIAVRLMRLEEFCMFLQRTVNDLDQVVLEQQHRIEALETRLSRLTTQVDRVTDQTYKPPSPEDEKPPHY